MGYHMHGKKKLPILGYYLHYGVGFLPARKNLFCLDRTSFVLSNHQSTHTQVKLCETGKMFDVNTKR